MKAFFLSSIVALSLLAPHVLAYDKNMKSCATACALITNASECSYERSVPRCIKCIETKFKPCVFCMKRCGLDADEAGYECTIDPKLVCWNVTP